MERKRLYNLHNKYETRNAPAPLNPATEEYANEVLSLPLFNGMTKEEVSYVIAVCNQYQNG